MKCHRMSTCQQFSRQDRGCPHRASINSLQRLGKPAIGGVMISVLASSVVDRGFESQ